MFGLVVFCVFYAALAIGTSLGIYHYMIKCKQYKFKQLWHLGIAFMGLAWPFSLTAIISFTFWDFFWDESIDE